MTQAAPPKLSYRAEVDGLRAIAVVSVILYHAKMVVFGRDWLEGGFIGVDIFFVISGYLITRIILSELQTESFSFLNFYERRARPILPVLFVVILVSMPFAWFILVPTEFVEYAQSILATLAFGSNFFFYFSTTEYGAESALLKPFLHTWSLGVEEQFYFIFPVIALIAYRYFRPHFLTIIIALSLLSLQFAESMEIRDAELNFFLPFSRFWELAVGSLLAYRELYAKPSEDNFAKRILPMVGLYLVMYSILFFDDRTPHPSFYTLVPIIGVALIIGYASKDELVGKMLGSKPFVWIGLISYSAYLWHFPIFAFARRGEDATNLEKLGWIALTLILSIASYFLVERPFRKKALMGIRTVCALLLAGFLIIGGAMVAVVMQDGFESRFPPIVGFENYERDNGKLNRKRGSIWRARKEANPHFLDVDIKVLVVGNSHATDMFNVLTLNNTSSDVDILRYGTQIACANETIPDYAKFRDAFYNSKNYKQATTIVISTRYHEETACKRRNETQPKTDDLDGLVFLINRAKADGKKVIVFGHTGEVSYVENLRLTDYIYEKYEEEFGEQVSEKYEEVKRETGLLMFELLNREKIERNKKIEKIANDLDVDYIDRLPLVCDFEDQYCSAFTDDGFKTMNDFHHWTLEGSRYFGKKLMEDGFMDRLR